MLSYMENQFDPSIAAISDRADVDRDREFS